MKALLQTGSSLPACGYAQAGGWVPTPPEKRFLINSSVGAAEDQRGQGTGKALLMACLLDRKVKGYGYAVIGMPG